MSSGGTLLPWVSVTGLASLGAVKPTPGSKVPPLETPFPDMEKKSSGFFISDDGKRHSFTLDGIPMQGECFRMASEAKKFIPAQKKVYPWAVFNPSRIGLYIPSEARAVIETQGKNLLGDILFRCRKVSFPHIFG